MHRQIFYSWHFGYILGIKTMMELKFWVEVCSDRMHIICIESNFRNLALES